MTPNRAVQLVCGIILGILFGLYKAESGTIRIRGKEVQISDPNVATLLGIGSFPGSHSMNLGMPGMHGMYWNNLAIQEADVLMLLRIQHERQEAMDESPVVMAGVNPERVLQAIDLVATDFQKGKTNSFQYLIGKAMTKSSGKADPALAAKILKKLLTK